MKTTKYIAAFVMGALLLLPACDDKLDIVPTDSIDDSKAFESIEDLEKGMIGVYVYLGNEDVVGISDRAGDDLRLSAQNTGQGVQVHNWTYNAGTGDVGSYWSRMYYAIDRANRLLRVAENFDADNEIVKRVKGESLFIRAWAHYELAKVYCKNYDAADSKGIPYMKESVISYPSRLSQGQVFANIITDMDAAMPYLTSVDRGPDYISEYALVALRARVAQHMGDWDEVIASTTQLIEESGFRLATIDEVQGIWEDSNPYGVEVILRAARIKGESLLGDIYTRASNGDIFFAPGLDLMSQFESDDVRATIYFGVDANGSDVVTKHKGRPGEETNLVDIKLFRMAEMYLMRAEAYAQKSMWEESIADLSEVRNNRISNPDQVIYGTFSEALKAIREERRRELAYEGFRFFDLKRWGLPVERTVEDSELASGKTLEAGNYRFVMPIPQEEIFANTNMVQNDGYESN